MVCLSPSVTKNVIPSPVDINQVIFKPDIYTESDNTEYILVCNTHSGTWLSIREVNTLDCNYRHSQRQKTKETSKRTYRGKSRRKETQEASIRRREESGKLERQSPVLLHVQKRQVMYFLLRTMEIMSYGGSIVNRYRP